MLGTDKRTLQQAWTWFLFILAIAVIYAIRQALVTFALAMFLALILAPVVTLVERFAPVRFPRAVSLAIVYVILLSALAAILGAIISAVSSEARVLAQKLPEALNGNPSPRLSLPTWLEPIREQLEGLLNDRLNEIGQNAVPLLGQAIQRLVSGVGAALSVILVPIVAFFFLKDGRAIRKGLLKMIDEEKRPVLGALLSDLREVLSQYVRALVILAAVTFVAYFAFLAVTGAPYAALLAGMAAMLEFIPGIGPFIAAVAILLVSVLSGYSHWILLLSFFVVYRLAQDYVLQPLLMSAGVELHPMLVIFGALAGAEIAGIMGVFFSVPLLAALRVIFRRLRGHLAPPPAVHHP